MNRLILIVEDNERNRKLVRTILEYRGFAVAECADGESAIAAAKSRLPALILMDIELPRLDGISTLKRLRADPRTALIPVVAVTASVTRDQRERISCADFNGYVAKPIDVEAFAATIEGLVGEGGAST